MTVEELLDAVAEKLGGVEALNNVRTTRGRGTMEFAGLSGAFSYVRESGGGRSRSDVDFGAFAQSNGYDGAALWSRDANGKLRMTNDPEAVAESLTHAAFDEDVYLTAREHYDYQLDAGDSEYILTVIDRRHADKPFAKTRIFIDRDSLLIVRRQTNQGGQWAVTHLEDYQRIENLLVALRTKDVDPSGNESTTTIESIEFNAPLVDADFLPPSEDVRDYEFLHGDASAIVPLRIAVDHIETDVVINGKSFTFYVDTGAGKSVIASDAVSELALETITTFKGQGVSGVQDIDLIMIPEMIVGDVRMFEQQVLAIDFTELRKKSPRFDGLVGMDFLNRFVVRFDYQAEEMTVYDRAHFSYEGDGERLAIDDVECTASVDGHEGKHTIDTGAGGYALHAPFVRRHGFVRNPDAMPHSSSIAGVGNVELVMYSAICHELRIGGFVLHDVPVGLADIDSGAFAVESTIGNIGGAVWRKFITYFDFTGNTMILEKSAEFDKPFPINKIGVGFKLEDGRYLAEAIDTLSPGAEAGIERGDELIEVDGRPVGEYSLDDLRLQARQEEGTVCHWVMLNSDGERRELDITLRIYQRYYDE